MQYLKPAVVFRLLFALLVAAGMALTFIPADYAHADPCIAASHMAGTAAFDAVMRAGGTEEEGQAAFDAAAGQALLGCRANIYNDCEAAAHAQAVDALGDYIQGNFETFIGMQMAVFEPAMNAALAAGATPEEAVRAGDRAIAAMLSEFMDESFLNPLLAACVPAAPVSLPPNAIANWSGNPLSPTFDGRLNSDAASAYVLFCKFDQLQIWSAGGAFVTQLALDTVLGLNPAGESVSFPNALFALGRSNGSLIVVGPDGFSFEFSLAACQARNG